MNMQQTTELLRLRRDLTGEQFNDGTLAAWAAALDRWPLEQTHTAVIAAARTHSRVNVAQVVEHLPQQHRPPTSDRHSASCLCASRGWIEIEQHDERHTWLAWDRCPNGPASAFYELD